jgi:hypothetical protein
LQQESSRTDHGSDAGIKKNEGKGRPGLPSVQPIQ